MKRIFWLFVCLTISVVSFGQDKAASSAAAPEIPPGSSMEETTAWIKRELKAMGSDHIITRYKETTWDDQYDIESAVLSEGSLKIRQVSQHDGAPNHQTDTSTITMKDVGRVDVRETTVAPGIIMSKPIYFVILTAIPDRGDPFLLESDGYAGGKTNMSVHVIRVQIRDQNEANQVADVFRRAAVLCGAPIQPVQTAADSSLATTAAAQRTPIPTASGVAAPPADAPKIDPSKVKFLMRACSKGIMGDDNAMFRRVIGTVALDIDLSQEATVRQLLTMAATFAQDKCPSPYPCGSICVYLRPGNPATFTDYKQGFEYVPESYLGIVYDSPPDSVSASTGDSRFEPERSQLTWVAYQNRPREIKDQQAQEAAQARQRDAAMEQQRQAEQKKQSEIAARSAAFVKANGVEHFVTVQQLAANPFVYQGQVVAIYGEFQQMNSATEGLFSVQDKSFVVSAIPAAKFTLPTSMVMLAGRVLGNIEIKLPVLGPTLVPHLSFVGSAFCQERGGSDYDINLK